MIIHMARKYVKCITAALVFYLFVFIVFGAVDKLNGYCRKITKRFLKSIYWNVSNILINKNSYSILLAYLCNILYKKPD